MSTCRPKRAGEGRLEPRLERPRLARRPRRSGCRWRAASAARRARARPRAPAGRTSPPAVRRRARCCRAARPRSAHAGASRRRRGGVVAEEVARRHRCRRPARSSKRSASRRARRPSPPPRPRPRPRARASACAPSASADSKVSRICESAPACDEPSACCAVEGAGEHRHQRELGLGELDDPDRRLLVVDADHDHARLGRAGRVQDVEPRPVAVVDLEAEVGRRLGSSRASVSMMLIVEAARQQRLADDLPDPAEADDERVAATARRPAPPRPSTAAASAPAGRAGSPGAASAPSRR